jgi:hydroxyethylthiazole kinase-like uncharacterized protein yjeF
MNETAVLTVAQMGEADQLAVEAGIPSIILMENAGHAVAENLAAHFPKARVAVLCGPGNNGGDGFCAARHLKDQGFDVRVALLGARETLKGDAAEMARLWSGTLAPLTPAFLEGADVAVDALFGAGLTRPLDGAAAETVRALNASVIQAVAVDVPSGLHGDTGKPLGENCVRAARTVTFFRKKPAHLLYPGRGLCGPVTVADIGTPEAVLETIRPRTFENGPALWRAVYPWPRANAHKYARGHAVVVSGPAHATGAARLAARGSLRVGAGLVSVASPLDAVAINSAHLAAIMVKPFDGAAGLSALLMDKRFNAVALGPGCGVGADTRDLVFAALASSASAVLDADALTSFAEHPTALFEKLRGDCVLTPHTGEFERLFPGLLAKMPSKLAATREAARIANCMVLLKGADTVIAAPDGCAVINANAPPFLATAGAGDVLAGMITGLLAEGMTAFDAACAAAWLHGEAANAFGIGLIAEDLPEQLPKVLRALKNGAV